MAVAILVLQAFAGKCRSSRSATQQKAAGCSGVQQTPNYQNAPGADPDIDHAHIGASAQFQQPPALSTYPTVPPASGPHNPIPAQDA